MVDEALDPQDLSRTQPRVGLSAVERLRWALDFAQSDPAKFTAADWPRWRLELTAFATLPVSRLIEKPYLLAMAADYAYGNNIYSRQQVRTLQTEFHRIVESLLRDKWVRVGEFKMTMYVDLSPLSPSRRPHMSKAEFQEFTASATYALGHLLKALGHRVTVCPAPAARAKHDEICGKWFVAARANQRYCSAQCQSRATTRAARPARARRKA